MQSLKLVLCLAAAFGVATGCAEDALRQESCDPGTKGCACGVDGECDTGLRCVEYAGEHRCVPIALTAKGVGGPAGSEGGGDHPPPDAGPGAGGSSGNAPSASGGAVPEADAGSSGPSTGSGGSAQGSGGSKASGGSVNNESGGAHNGSGGTPGSSGGHPASGGAAPAAGGAAAGGAAGSEGTRPGLSEGCLSCAMEQCGAIAKQCEDDEICSGCIAGKGKGGDCSPFDSVYGGLLMCVCSVPECVESCGPSCPRR